ncbi:MAG: hypothetical protein ACXWJ2_04935 [Hyphomicrobium sp.]
MDSARPVKAVAFALSLLLVFAQAAAAETAAAVATADDTAKILAGMPPSADSPLASYTKDGSWQQHAKRFDAAWAALDKRQLSKIKAWSTQYLPPRKPAVFYFFSGPDFLYADAFYPGADTYVMAALEPVGEIPDLTGMSRGQVEGGIGRIENSLNTVLNYSFFITKKMRGELSGGRFGGTLPILYVFLERSGKTIRDVSLVALDADGNVKPANDPALPKNPPRGAKITFSTGADGKPQTLYYFSTDLSNDGVKTGGFLKFCDTFGLADSFIKSASYLLHADSFSTIRSYIVDHSDVVVEDDSGVPVRFFKPDEWQLMAFGNYVPPLGIFPHTYQPTLHDLYRKRTAALDFGIGYRWRPSESNVLLAIRGSKTAQQTPAPQNK